MIQFLAYVILSQKKDIFFAIYRIINWMSIFSHKNLWAFKTLNAYQKVSCVWMLCWLFECILIKKWVLVGEYRVDSYTPPFCVHFNLATDRIIKKYIAPLYSLVWGQNIAKIWGEIILKGLSHQNCEPPNYSNFLIWEAI